MLEDSKIYFPRMREYGRFRIGQYSNGRIALELKSKHFQAICRLTVNLPDDSLEPGEFFIKTWSENKLVIEPIRECGLFVDTGKRVSCGFVEAEVWRFANKVDERKMLLEYSCT